MKHLFYFYIIAVLLGLQGCRKATSSREHLRGDSKTEMQEDVTLPVVEMENVQKSNKGRTYSATELFKRYNSAVFMVFTTDGYNAYQGSGFFISKDGLAVSNYHVFKGTGIGYEVIKLKRESFGFLMLGSLKSGEKRKLSIKDVKRLISLAKGNNEQHK